MTASTNGLVSAFLEDGEIRTDFIPGWESIKDMAHPTTTELNGTKNLCLSEWLTATGWKLSHTQETIKDDREASASTGEIPGAEKFDGASLQVIDNINKQDQANTAVETLTKGTKGYFVRRRGDGSKENPYKVGQVISVYQVTIGIKVPVAHADNARQMSTINFSVSPGAYDETATVTDPTTATGNDTEQN